MQLIYYIQENKEKKLLIEEAIKNAECEGYVFHTSQAFFNKFNIKKPDLVLLDVLIKDMSGLEVLELIKKTDPNMPVILISSNQSDTNKMSALDLGVDDYMKAPFGVIELAARLKARLKNSLGNHILSFKNLRIDKYKHMCVICDNEVHLTNKEYDIISILLENQNSITTKEMIFKSIWKSDYIGNTRTLDMHIKSLREKIKKYEGNLEIITIRGLGYQIR